MSAKKIAGIVAAGAVCGIAFAGPAFADKVAPQGCAAKGSTTSCSFTAGAPVVKWGGNIGANGTWSIVDQTAGTTLASGVGPQTDIEGGTTAVHVGDVIVISKTSGDGWVGAAWG
jgi:hypothetical protein